MLIFVVGCDDGSVSAWRLKKGLQDSSVQLVWKHSVPSMDPLPHTQIARKNKIIHGTG